MTQQEKEKEWFVVLPPYTLCQWSFALIFVLISLLSSNILYFLFDILCAFPRVISESLWKDEGCPEHQSLNCRARGLCTGLSDKLILTSPHPCDQTLWFTWWPGAVCIGLVRLDVDTLHTVTKIRLLSDVGEANTCSSVSKTIHKRGCVAPYLELMLDPLCTHISICLRTVFLVYVCVVLWFYCAY